MTTKIALYDGLRDAEPKALDLEWPELVELLTTHEQHCDAATCRGRDCPAKDAGAWSPVDIDGPRADDNVRAVTAFVADLDHCALSVDEIVEKVRGFAAVLHSTHSHSDDDRCFRLVLPLSRPATHAEWPAVRRAVVEALALPADPSCRDRSRLYFLPASRGGVAPVAVKLEGDPIDVDQALELAGAGAAGAAFAPPAAQPVSLEAVRAAVERARASKSAERDLNKKEQAEILGRVLEGRALAAAGERDTTLLRACGLVARHAPPDTTWDAARALLEPSLRAMDVEPEGFEAWLDVARVKYERAALARARQDARSAAEAAAVREVVKSRSAPAAPGLADADEEWQERLVLKGGEVRAANCNALEIISNAPELRDVLRWDDFAKRVVVCGGPLAGAAPASVDTELAAFLERQYHFFASSEMVGRCAQVVARKNTFDSLKEYLGELAWDGAPRLDRFLVDYFGCEDSEYVRAVSRRWLVSLAARGLEPGSQVDTVLILEGPQGGGKSSALRDLVGRERFLDTALELGEKDTMQSIASVWLVELGELASLSRAEIARVKQFVTSRVDKFRPPYGRVIESFDRRCVFVGTTNDEFYLVDRTGNRRYWPVRVGRIDRAAILRDREKILAEAVQAFLAGERWWFTPEEQARAEQHAEERVVSSAVGERVARWWFGQLPAQRPRRVSMTDVAEALQVPVDRLTHAAQTEIGHAMRKMGFSRQRLTEAGSGKLVRYYVPPDALLAAPQETSASRARFQAMADAARSSVVPN